MSLPRLPYLQNAVAGYTETLISGRYVHADYIAWMRQQGVIMPIGKDVANVDLVVINFIDPQSELIFALRWS